MVERRYGETIRDVGHREHVSAGRPTFVPWAESPSLYLAALRLARVRCERGSVVAVLPASSPRVNSEAQEADR